ncbi:MAG TPA: trypsin-like peptidase domain-containing protein, partial [Mycobacteriales bacterium]|nr:trypsin-like peptidase domain-containing protein [Mycobacteriales bacterium]
MTDPEDFDVRTAVVRILDANDVPQGAGFLVGLDGLVATCAHVVSGAGSGPGSTVTVDFPMPGRTLPALVLAEFWRDAAADDVALLRLAEPAPAGARPLSLKRVRGSTGNRFVTYGFPPELGDRGLYGYGIVGDLTRDRAGIALLQLTQTTETSPGFSGGPVVDQPSQRVIGLVNSITPANRYGRLSETAFATPADVLREICPLLRVAEVCPYRSLDVFEEEHAPYFFGRESTLDRLLTALRRQDRFLALLGPSGSGKSSLLRAGLAARLRSGALPGSAGWELAVVRPADLAHGAVPTGRVLMVDQFEEIFTLPAGDAALVASRLDERLAGPGTVVLAMRDDFYSELAGTYPVLTDRWVVPNLVNVPATLSREELTSIVVKPAQKAGLELEAGLVESVVDGAIAAAPAAQADRARNTVLPLLEFGLTQLWQRQYDGVLRRDDYRGIGPELAEWADRTYYGLPEQLRLVARRLLLRLTHVVDDGSDSPPSRRRRFIDDLTGSGSESAMREVLGRLVTARLLVLWQDEPTGRTTVELAHEALLREWQLLRDWLRADREFLTWRDGLDRRVRAVSAAPVDEDTDWLGGRELDQALEWARTRSDELLPAQREFIARSAAARDRRLAEERRLREEVERQQRAAEYNQQLADARKAVADLRLDTENALALLPVAPAVGLAEMVAVIGRNLVRLGDTPLGFVQAGLRRAVRTAAERFVLTGHSGQISAVAVIGADVLSASWDGTVRRWSLGGGTSGEPWHGHFGAVRCLVVSPDGTLVATGGSDGTVRLWTPDGTPVGQPLPGDGEAVLALAVEADGHLAAGSAGGTLTTWSVAGVPAIVGSSDFGPAVTALFATASGELFVGTGGGRLEARSIQSCQVIAPSATASGNASPGNGEDWIVMAQAHAGPVTAIAAGERPHIASGGLDGRLIRSRDGGREFNSVLATEAEPIRAVLCPVPNSVITASEDGTVALRDLAGREIHPRLPVAAAVVTSLANTADAAQIVGGCSDGTVRVWDWGPLRTEIAAADDDLAAWDEAGDQAGRALLGHSDGVAAVAFSPDGRLLASGGFRRDLRIWEVGSGRSRVVPEAHAGSITGLAWAPSGFPMLASAGRDQLVRLWGSDGRPLGEPFAGHTADVMALAFSPGGDLLVTGGRDATVRRWRTNGEQVGEPLRGHEQDVAAVAVSPDGTHIAGAGRDGTIRLWDADGTAGPVLRGHQGAVLGIAFGADGRRLVSCGDDRTIRIWPLDDIAATRSLRGHSAE